MATPFKLKKDFDFGNKGNFNLSKKRDYSAKTEKDYSPHNISARRTEGTIKEQEARMEARRLKLQQVKNK